MKEETCSGKGTFNTQAEELLIYTHTHNFEDPCVRDDE